MLPKCEAALAGYQQDGNTVALAVLDEQLARAAEYRGQWDEITAPREPIR